MTTLHGRMGRSGPRVSRGGGVELGNAWASSGRTGQSPRAGCHGEEMPGPGPHRAAPKFWEGARESGGAVLELTPPMCTERIWSRERPEWGARRDWGLFPTA